MMICRVSVQVAKVFSTARAVEEEAQNNLQPIDPHSRQILHVQGDQCLSKSITHVFHIVGTKLFLELACKRIGFPLEFAAEGVHSDANECLKGSQDHLTRQSAHNTEIKHASANTWNSIKAMIVGGRAATLFEKLNERSKGGACRNAGKKARIVKM
jgi:hypothetical protein